MLITLRTLLGEPNGADGLVPEVTKQFGVDYEGWWREAEGVTRREATEEKLRVMEDGVAAVVVEVGRVWRMGVWLLGVRWRLLIGSDRWRRRMEVIGLVKRRRRRIGQ